VLLRITKNVHPLLKYSYFAKEDVICGSLTMMMGTRSVSKTVRGIHLGAPANATIILFDLVTFFWGCDRNEEIKVYRLVKPSGESEPIGKDAIASTNAPVKSTLELVPTPTGDVPVPAEW